MTQSFICSVVFFHQEVGSRGILWLFCACIPLVLYFMLKSTCISQSSEGHTTLNIVFSVTYYSELHNALSFLLFT